MYSGDPKVFIDENGAYFEFKNSQPIMDQGLENYVGIALFTEENWAGDILFPDENQKVGKSKFLQACRKPKTRTSLFEIEEEGKAALKSLINSNLASEINVSAAHISSVRTDIKITIKRPNLDDIELLLIKNGVNWLYQANDPAHRR